MFGESESESPRSRSPWDSLSTPVPKLVPEVEQGNVEYKLQLLSPTPARFARLVTQLKWRLLEGGGQAYYELGVADSGLLIGLPRQQLEDSLETLEAMAGEIGASVIVVKEIQVPPHLASLAESRLERWEDRKSARRKRTTFETELSNTDAEESPVAPPLPLEEETLPITAPALPDEHVDNEATDDPLAQFSVEISSVYKPRPMKKPPNHITAPPLTHLPYTRKKLKNGHPPSKSTDAASDPIVHSRKAKRDKRAKTKTNPQHSISSPLLVPHPSSLPNIVIESVTEDVEAATASVSKEPRLIVEVLVVRKLSLDEAFLDFEGFSLQ